MLLLLYIVLCKQTRNFKLAHLWMNQMQSETAGFAQVTPPGELDETHASPLILANSLHYEKTWRRAQNRKCISYIIALPTEEDRDTATGNILVLVGWRTKKQSP